MGSVFSKTKVDLYFFNRNHGTNLYIEIVEFSLPEINKIKFLVILQFDSDRKHRSLKALEFYNESNIKIIDRSNNSPDLNPIKNIWAKKISYGDKNLIASTSKGKD